MNKLFITEKNEAGKGTILMIHGSSSSSRVYDKVIESDALPYKLITFDLPGHGKSAWDADAGYGMDTYRKKVLQIISDQEQVLIVGNSLGGHIALEVVNEVTSLKGLVIFGTPPVKKPINVAEAFLPNPILQTYFTASVTESDLDLALNEAVQNKAVIPLLKEDFLKCDPLVRTVIGREIEENLVFSDEADVFKNLNVPRFILHGRQDPTVNPEYLNMLCRESSGFTEIELFENCGHYPSLERPARFISKLNAIAAQSFE